MMVQRRRMRSDDECGGGAERFSARVGYEKSQSRLSFCYLKKGMSFVHFFCHVYELGRGFEGSCD